MIKSKTAWNMKGDITTKTYTKQGSENADKIKSWDNPAIPYHIWVHELTGTEMKIPVGVPVGKKWKRKE